MQSVEESSFLEGLRRSRLLDAELIAQVVSAKSPLELPQRFLKANLLTPWQVEQIEGGNARRLKVGDYPIVEIIGWGGMGTVFKVIDPKTKRPVALKVLAERFRHDSGMRARFGLEAKAGSLCDHPHLLHTIESGITEDLFGDADYQLLDLFEGIALHELVNLRGPLQVGLACDIGRQAAEGLSAMHVQGMVHRDVKPDNILVDRAGHVKVLDYGLALADKANSDEFSLSMIFGHDCLGTPDYIAPEQSVDSLKVDQRADVYSLGCTLFAILAGRPPFQGADRSQVVKAHRELPARSIRKYVASVPVELDAYLQKMMAKRPEDRPADMKQVAQALKAWAKPSAVDFNWNVILKARRRIAEKKGWEKGTSRVGQSGVLSPTRTTRLSTGSTVSERPRRKVEFHTEPASATPNALQLVAAVNKDARQHGSGAAKRKSGSGGAGLVIGLIAFAAALMGLVWFWMG
jgi:serine/threonine protein kinase